VGVEQRVIYYGTHFHLFLTWHPYKHKPLFVNFVR